MNTAVKPKGKGIDLSGLDNFNVSSLMEAGAPGAVVVESNGAPLEISLAEIIEDPNQPRTAENPGFSPESLAELADSIKASGGVKTPISVRSRNADGLYVINHGARRFRASVLAATGTIKAFIDDSHDDYDQAIENIQRENFTPMEIAQFIGRREHHGDSRAAIAKRLGKSKAFVTQHAALLVMSNLLRVAYDEGRCRDVLALYDLTNLEKKFPVEVGEFIEREQEITRTAVEGLKTALKAAAEKADAGGAEGEGGEGEDQEAGSAADAKAPKAKAGKPLVMVKRRKDENLFVLRFDKKPTALHMGWIEDPETGGEVEVELSDLAIDSIVEAD